jgi:predicted phage-related endonuclease
MRFGSMAEKFVADEYTAATGRRVEGYTRMLRLGEGIPLIGHVDRLVIPEGAGAASIRKTGEIRTDRLLECKTAHPMALSGGEWGDSGTDLVPPAYLVQCAAYLALTGCAVADLACLFGNQELRVYTIRRDLELEASLIEAATVWWNRHVVADVPPEPSTPDECRRLWPSHLSGKSLIVDLTVAKDIEALAACKAEIKQIETAASEIETRVLAAFGDAEEITYMGRKLASWKQNKPGQKTDWKALVHHHWPVPPADLVEQFTTTTPGARVLRLAKQEQ